MKNSDPRTGAENKLANGKDLPAPESEEGSHSGMPKVFEGVEDMFERVGRIIFVFTLLIMLSLKCTTGVIRATHEVQEQLDSESTVMAEEAKS